MERKKNRFARIAKADGGASTAVDAEEVTVKLLVRGDTLKAMHELGENFLPVLGKAIVSAVQKSSAVAENQVPSEPAPIPSRTLKRAILSKSDSAEEERYVLGVVMEPDEVDTQGHTQTAETVRKAAYQFMEAYRSGGEAGHMCVMHKRDKDGNVVASDNAFAILESYIQKSDETINGEVLKAGSWMMAVRAIDDGIWEDIKKGVYTGFSIGGTAIVRDLTDS